MRNYRDVVSPALAEVLEGQSPQPDDVIFFADDTSAKCRGERVRHLVGLGCVTLGYFVRNKPDGMLRDSVEYRVADGKNSGDMLDKLADMICSRFERLPRGSRVLACAVCNLFSDGLDGVRRRLAERGCSVSVLPVSGLERKRSDGTVVSREPKDYAYKQQVGDYARRAYASAARQRRKHKLATPIVRIGSL